MWAIFYGKIHFHFGTTGSTKIILERFLDKTIVLDDAAYFRPSLTGIEKTLHK